MKGTLAELARKLRHLSQGTEAGKRKAKSPRREERYLPSQDAQGNRGEQRVETQHSSQTLFRICGLL